MLEEIESIESNKTWRLVTLPHGHHPVGLKWVYKLKKDAAGEVVKHKVWLVAKGYIQQQGVDFDEVFTPVARIESVQRSPPRRGGRLCRRRLEGQGTATRQGALQTPSGTARVECKAGRDAGGARFQCVACQVYWLNSILISLFQSCICAVHWFYAKMSGTVTTQKLLACSKMSMLY
jgi:hypothetical protein